jgi:hypothetical protein
MVSVEGMYMKPRCNIGLNAKRMFWLALSLIGLATFHSTLVMAGAGGDYIMTYYFDSPLAKDLKVDISTGGDHHCMYHYAIGSRQKTYTIPKGTIGLFELNKKQPIHFEVKSSSTGGDVCATDPSYWHVEVKADDSRYSFTSALKAKSGNFFRPNSNEIEFKGDDPANQFICVGRSLCSSKSYSYHYTNSATVHIIYRPTY